MREAKREGPVRAFPKPYTDAWGRPYTTNAEREGCTYADIAGVENNNVRGRFAEIERTERAEMAKYPRQPEGSPWAGDPVGDEPSLGVPIDQQPVNATTVGDCLAVTEAPERVENKPSTEGGE